MRARLIQIIKELSDKDLDLLHHLYLYRCLTIHQAREFIYRMSDRPEYEFYEDVVERLLELGVVELVEYLPNDYVFFLTTNGVDIVRHTKEIPLEIFNPDTKIVKRGYYRASELKIHTRLINHQVSLNQFVLEFQEIARRDGLKWKYYDEKYVSQYLTIRPDGLIQLLDTDFFLEMDMGSESKKQLIEKWDNYQSFIHSSEFRNNERNIIVLFILENVNNTDRRTDLVRYTAMSVIGNFFSDRFDMVIGSKEEILSHLFDSIIPDLNHKNTTKEEWLRALKEKHGFQVDYAEPLKKALNDGDYEFYIRKVNEKNKHIVVENGRLQEYLLDDYSVRKLSVLNRIQFHATNASMFQLKFKRRIAYIVVAPDEYTLYQDLKVTDSLFFDQVFFTTPKRLKERPFHEAVFQFDIEGGIYHFADTGLQQQVYEKNVNEIGVQT